MIKQELLSIRIFLVKIVLKIEQEKYLLSILFRKLILGNYKIKDLNGEKIIGSFYEKELLRSILKINYYPEPDSHIRDKVRVVLDLKSYATKKDLEHANVIDKSDLAVKNDYIA